MWSVTNASNQSLRLAMAFMGSSLGLSPREASRRQPRMAKMLSIELFVDGELVDRVDVVDVGWKNKKGESLYNIVLPCYEMENKYQLWHKPSSGARSLARKVLNELKRKRRRQKK